MAPKRITHAGLVIEQVIGGWRVWADFVRPVYVQPFCPFLPTARKIAELVANGDR